jgi:hypothetical protein
MRLGKELPIPPRFVAAIVKQPVLDPRKIRISYVTYRSMTVY